MPGPIFYDPAAIRRLCGEEGAAYAGRKQRGGRAGQVGWRFEALYAAYRIALQARAEYQAGGTGRGVWFQDQVGGFVDDLAVVAGEAVTLSQAKSGQVGWNAGVHPLAEDFRLQALLDADAGRAASYELVVATDAAREAMLAGRPPGLGDVAVTAFRAAGPDIPALLAAHPELAEALDAVSLRKPSDIVREQTFQAVLGAWVHSEGDACLADLLDRLAGRPDALVRVPGPDHVLPERVVERLGAVRNLAWRVVGRHFWYEAGGARGRLTGWAAHLCGTPGFERFERFLVEEQPTRWLDVVRELRRES